MKLRIRLWIWMLVCIISILPETAYAATGLPDPGQKGSISVTIYDKEQRKPVSGGSLKLYQVAELVIDDEEYMLQFTEEFAECQVDLTDLDVENLSSGEIAEKLAVYAKDKKLTEEKIPVNTQGNALVEKLEIGLYLITQEEAAKDYDCINPFLISIPIRQEDEYIYDLVASPKVSPAKDKDDNPPEETKPSGSLPKTGQLWWPVPILAAAGLLIFALGWKRRQGSGE